MTPEEKARAAAEQVAAIGMPETGQEPAFMGHPALDALLEAVVALGGELWIERDRRRTLETLLAEKGVVAADDLEAFEPSEAQCADRDEALADMTRRIFEPLTRIGRSP